MKRFFLLTIISIILASCTNNNEDARQIINLNDNWKFFKYSKNQTPDSLIYDVRPSLENNQELRVADAKPTDAVEINSQNFVLKPWILPTMNNFIKGVKYTKPSGNPGEDFPFVKLNFDDNNWQTVDIPHDWAIKEEFQKGDNPEVGGGMGRLPVNGIAWYRKKFSCNKEDLNKNIFLEIGGAMSYSMVWINDSLAGGWPYGYNSYQLDITNFVKEGENQIAIRIDNPNHSARWYPGAGLYREVKLIKTNKIYISQYGTRVICNNISKENATINFSTKIKNSINQDAQIKIETEIIFNNKVIKKIEQNNQIAANSNQEFLFECKIENPNLWSIENPNMYLANSKIYQNNILIDNYQTPFGIRQIEFDANQGILINGKLVKIQGVNQHHDLGALGSAFNVSAAVRQLEILKEMGCNAIRMSHNPPDSRLLDLCDQMGFMVIDEIFDSWEKKKTAHDFHLIFKDWHEADIRNFVQRDKNHPSIIMWSFGNEVGEQYTDSLGAKLAMNLKEIVLQEDNTRPTTFSMNFAKPYMPLPQVSDVIGLNYQGEGIRQEKIFEGTDRIRTAPQYMPFHQKFPNKVIYSSESASACSSRGVYYFPVTENVSSPIRDTLGGSEKDAQVSSYELYAVDFGSSADKVFMAQDQNPFVAGEFVWNGFDYIGEPTPYYQSRSSYTGIIDLAGFPKDRYYLYQSRWRKDFKQVHILPHWNWENRIEEITPVHIFTSGDEVELFLNGKSLGRKIKKEFEYRIRFDSVVYQPGELKAVAYKNKEFWAEETIKTSSKASKMQLSIYKEDRISCNKENLIFVTVKLVDKDNNFVANACDELKFTVTGVGEFLASDNGDANDLNSFSNPNRKAFNGLALVIIKPTGQKGKINLKVESENLETANLEIEIRR